MASTSNGSCRNVARIWSCAERYCVCASSIAARLAWIWPRSRSASAGGKVAAMRSTRTNTLRSQAGGGRRADRHRHRDADEEQIERERAEQQPARRAARHRGSELGDGHGRAPVSASGSNTIEPRSARLAIANGAYGRVEAPVEPGNADDEAERGAAGQAPRRAARPARIASRAARAGRRHSGIFCRGSGPLRRLSTRSTAASSAGGACVWRLSAASRKVCELVRSVSSYSSSSITLIERAAQVLLAAHQQGLHRRHRGVENVRHLRIAHAVTVSEHDRRCAGAPAVRRSPPRPAARARRVPPCRPRPAPGRRSRRPLPARPRARAACGRDRD